MITNNKILIDLNKVQWASLIYRNQEGITRSEKPKHPSAHGTTFDADAYAYPHHDYPKETMIERARRLDILDVWTPILIIQLSSNHSLRYSGKQALSLWKAWQGKIFGTK